MLGERRVWLKRMRQQVRAATCHLYFFMLTNNRWVNDPILTISTHTTQLIAFTVEFDLVIEDS